MRIAQRLLGEVVQLDGGRERELLIAPAESVVTGEIDGRLATGDQASSRLREPRGARKGASCLFRLAGERLLGQQRGPSERGGGGRGRTEDVLVPNHDGRSHVRECRRAGFGGLGTITMANGAEVGRERERESSCELRFAQHLLDLGGEEGVRTERTTGDVRGVVPNDVGEDDRMDRGRGEGESESSGSPAGEPLADRVGRADGQSRLEQEGRERGEVFAAHAVLRRSDECARAAGDQRDHRVVCGDLVAQCAQRVGAEA